MERDLSKVWLCGIHDPNKNYGLLLHAGFEEDVRATYDAMMRGAKSSGANTQCLKLLSPDEWTSMGLKKMSYTAPEVFFDQLLNGEIGFDKLF